MEIKARAGTLAMFSAILLVGCSNSGAVANGRGVPSGSPMDGSSQTDAPQTDAPVEAPPVDASGSDAVADAVVDVGPSVPDVGFTYDAGPPPTAWNSLPPKCAAAAEKGVTYLVSQQKSDGSWGSGDPYRLAATGLAVVKLETYATEKGMDPFDPAYQYHTNVMQGLTYLFDRLSVEPMSGAFDTNNDGKGVAYSPTVGDANYVGAIILMAITAGKGTTQTVNAPSSQVNGWSFPAVAQDMVDWFSQCQVASQGGWRYTCPSSNSDNSVSQYVSLGLEYSEHPDYHFLCTIPAAVPNRLTNWVGAIQNMASGSDYGGSGYTDSVTNVNTYKTGALLQELAFLGQYPNTKPVQAALQYLNNHWGDPISGNPAHYMDMWAIMKGLVGQGVTMVGTHDWYQEYCDVLVSQQNANGSWPMAQWDNPASGGILSDTWALLVLEKSAPPPG